VPTAFDTQGHRQHGFAGTGWPEQQQIVAALDEAQSDQLTHQLAVN
jgi:hypothetical protein